MSISPINRSYGERIPMSDSHSPFRLRALWNELVLPDTETRNAPAIIAGAYLVLLFFFMFQLHHGGGGYQPFRPNAAISYLWKSTLAALLFFGPMLLVLPRFAAARAAHYLTFTFALSALVYFGVRVSGRPEWATLNDRSEAIQIAVSRLASGAFPYAQPTHKGGPISVFSGTLLLGAPATLLFGRAELTSVPLVLLAVIAFAALRVSSRSKMPLLIPVGLAVLNPVTVWELSFGSDLMWAPILLMMAVVLLRFGKTWPLIPLCAIAFATRASLAPVLLLWVVGLFRILPRRKAALVTISILALLVLMHLPFVLWDATTYMNYAPIGVSQSKLSLPAPAGDNLLSDVANGLLPTGVARTYVVSLAFAIGSVISGFAVRGKSSLLAWTAVWLTVPQFFMNEFHLPDYLVQAIFPLCALMLMPSDDAGGTELDSASPTIDANRPIGAQLP